MIEAWIGGAAALSFSFTLLLCLDLRRRFPSVGHRVNVGPGRLHIVETAPRAPARGAVLLVHGASGNFADPHVALAERLAGEGFRVFAVDRPGHGYSDRLGGRSATSPRRQAAWIRAGLESLGVADAILVVHSLAGVLGLAMALDSPSFTRGLVLLSPVSHPWRTGVSWYYTVAATPVVGALFCWLVAPAAGLALTPGALRSVFAPNAAPPDYARRTRLALLFRPWHFRANAEDFVDLCAEAAALSPRYREIVAPTAIATGAQDKLVSIDIHARACAREIPGATLQLLPGIGHSPHFAATEAVVATILEVAARAQAAARSHSETV